MTALIYVCLKFCRHSQVYSKTPTPTSVSSITVGDCKPEGTEMLNTAKYKNAVAKNRACFPSMLCFSFLMFDHVLLFLIWITTSPCFCPIPLTWSQFVTPPIVILPRCFCSMSVYTPFFSCVFAVIHVDSSVLDLVFDLDFPEFPGL